MKQIIHPKAMGPDPNNLHWLFRKGRAVFPLVVHIERAAQGLDEIVIDRTGYRLGAQFITLTEIAAVGIADELRVFTGKTVPFQLGYGFVLKTGESIVESGEIWIGSVGHDCSPTVLGDV